MRFLQPSYCTSLQGLPCVNVVELESKNHYKRAQRSICTHGLALSIRRRDLMKTDVSLGRARSPVVTLALPATPFRACPQAALTPWPMHGQVSSVLAQSLALPSVVMGKSEQQELKAADHTVPTVKKQNAGAQLCFRWSRTTTTTGGGTHSGWVFHLT